MINDSHKKLVNNFMDACGQTERYPLDNKLTSKDVETIQLRLRLHVEEFSELFESFTTKEVYRLGFASLFKMLDFHISALEIQDISIDRVEALDALADIDYISCGTAVYLKLPLEEAFQEVHNNNMTKIDKDTGKVIKNEQGKILKPSSWIAPDLQSILKTHDTK